MKDLDKTRKNPARWVMTKSNSFRGNASIKALAAIPILALSPDGDFLQSALEFRSLFCLVNELSCSLIACVFFWKKLSSSLMIMIRLDCLCAFEVNLFRIKIRFQNGFDWAQVFSPDFSSKFNLHLGLSDCFFLTSIHLVPFTLHAVRSRADPWKKQFPFHCGWWVNGKMKGALVPTF